MVTGGAGYLGSHMVRQLFEANTVVVAYDNLSKGHREAVRNAPLIEGDIRNSSCLAGAIDKYAVDSVIHFAASSLVQESMEDPQKYYLNNVGRTLNLLKVMREKGVNQIIFSSTASVYGEPEKVPIKEDAALHPINVYGRSKLMIEQILADYSRAFGLRYVSLRYFNVAGAHPSGEIGEDHSPETHIIPLIMKTLLGQRENFTLFGTDYPTEDGTCVRDYIHVTDLCDAHLLALSWLAKGGESGVYNLGNGKGFSNRQLIKTAGQVTGKKLNLIEGMRRPGDPAVLVASSDKISRELGWKPRFPSLGAIMDSAWHWHRSHPKGY
jgi:UDP-glucose 4-epimerase